MKRSEEDEDYSGIVQQQPGRAGGGGFLSSCAGGIKKAGGRGDNCDRLTAAPSLFVGGQPGDGGEMMATESSPASLKDSGVLTSHSTNETGSFSEDQYGAATFPGGGWLSGGLSDFRDLAVSLKETAGDVVGYVHRSALSVAAEIAELERAEDIHRHGREDGQRTNTSAAAPPSDYCSGAEEDEFQPLRLPWEIPVVLAVVENYGDDTSSTPCGGDSGDRHDVKHEQVQQEEFEQDMDLKEKVFQLSYNERTFLEPFSSSSSSPPSPQQKDDSSNADDDNEDQYDTTAPSFTLTERRIQLIRQLLELDEGLARSHARMSGRTGRSNVRETVFWRNYFYHCSIIRQEHIERMYEENLADGTSDTSSYVCVSPSNNRSLSSSLHGQLPSALPSAPSSLNSAGIRSVSSDEDIVLIDSSVSKVVTTPPRMKKKSGDWCADDRW